MTVKTKPAVQKNTPQQSLGKKPDAQAAPSDSGVKPQGAAPQKPAASVRRRAGRGALLLIAGLLAVAGALRLGGGIGQVLARETATEHAMPTHGDVSDTDIATCPDLPSDMAGTAELLAALRAREQRVSADETALAERKQALSLVEAQVESRLAALVAAEQKLSATLALADNAAENDLSRLTAVYENMKPKEAALLFEAMAPEFAAGFLARMRPESAAALLAGLSAEKGYALSVLLAGRNAMVPKE